MARAFPRHRKPRHRKFEALMTYDVEAVRSDGWLAAAMPVPVVDKEDKDPVDYTLGSGRAKQRYRSRVLPREIVVERLCEAEGVGINVWGALAGGMLSGKFLADDPSKPPPPGVKPYPATWDHRYFNAVTRLKEIAGDRSLSQLSIAWLLHNPLVSSVVCGVSSVEQLDENLGSLELELSADDLRDCDEVWRMLMPKPTMFYARGYGIEFG
jgi:hypothetical protein